MEEGGLISIVLRVLHRVTSRLDRLYLITLDPETLRPRLGGGPAFAAREVVTTGVRLDPAGVAKLPDTDPIWATHLVR